MLNRLLRRDGQRKAQYTRPRALAHKKAASRLPHASFRKPQAASRMPHASFRKPQPAHYSPFTAERVSYFVSHNTYFLVPGALKGIRAIII